MQVNLTERSGLPIALDLESGSLTATGDVDLGEQSERRLSQLKDVLADPDAAIDDRICYRTYRGAGTKKDLEILEKHCLRYDLTVTLPGLIGREFAKTAGHVHSLAPDGVAYPEIYEVHHGRAAFVLQGGLGKADVWVQICEPGDRILIPTGCGHVSVNIGEEPLVVSDLIAEVCTNDYEPFRKRRGAAYYVVELQGSFNLKKNHHYSKEMAKPEVGQGSRWPQLLPFDGPLIKQFRQSPDDFQLLVSPHAAFVDIWSPWW